MSTQNPSTQHAPYSQPDPAHVVPSPWYSASKESPGIPGISSPVQSRSVVIRQPENTKQQAPVASAVESPSVESLESDEPPPRPSSSHCSPTQATISSWVSIPLGHSDWFRSTLKPSHSHISVPVEIPAGQVELSDGLNRSMSKPDDPPPDPPRPEPPRKAPRSNSSSTGASTKVSSDTVPSERIRNAPSMKNGCWMRPVSNPSRPMLVRDELRLRSTRQFTARRLSFCCQNTWACLVTAPVCSFSMTNSPTPIGMKSVDSMSAYLVSASPMEEVSVSRS